MVFLPTTRMWGFSVFTTSILFLAALNCYCRSPEGGGAETVDTINMQKTHHLFITLPIHKSFAYDVVQETSFKSSIGMGKYLRRLRATSDQAVNFKRQEMEALMAFKDALSIDPDANVLSDWQANDFNDSNACEWTGVVCSSHYPNHIIALRLPCLELKGMLNLVLQKVGFLPFLKALDLSNNLLSGSIPANLLANCSKLSSLNFSFNSLTSGIPWQLGEIVNLRYLELSGNNLTGEIPPSLSNCSLMKHLGMAYNKLSGRIPSEIGTLLELRILSFAGNVILGGLIPPELGRLINLESLDLSSSNFYGSFPDWIVNLTALNTLILSHNGFDGRIPKRIGELHNLNILELDSNNFAGKIPKSITNCTALIILHGSQNLFTGEIPVQLGLLNNLQKLEFWGNYLTGTIPSSIANCSRLTVLSLGAPMPNTFQTLESPRTPWRIPYPATKLMDPQVIPFWIGSLINLQYLYLGVVNLHGEIPKTVGNLSQILVIVLHGNYLNGVIPAVLGNLTRLVTLELVDNQLTGEIPFGIWQIPGLQILRLGLNSLTGSLPASFANMTQIISLELEFNRLGGKIDGSVGRLWRLEFFSADGNHFKGSLPSTIGNLSDLLTLSLQGNGLSGVIPLGFGNMTSLVSLDLADNFFEGNIPTDLMRCKRLAYLVLGYNLLEGSIPFDIGLLTFMEQLDLSHNNLSGILPSSLGNCERIIYLDLCCNKFVGTIPGNSIAIMARALNKLDLSNNLFTGSWPEEFSELVNSVWIDVSTNNISGSLGSLGTCRALEWLNISVNEFTGAIPLDVGTLPSLRFFNASYNNFEGAIPLFNITLNETCFLGNPRLCGSILPHRRCAIAGSKMNSKACEGIKCKNIWISVACAIIGFVVLARGVLWWMTMFHSKDDVRNFQHVMMNFASHMRFSERNILEIIGDDQNIIGAGGKSTIYKGTSPGGEVYAVKLLRSSLDDDDTNEKERDSELIKEVNILAKLRHKNILKVLSFYSNLDIKAMILEYMSQGSLHKHLHEQLECDLTWEARFKIAMGVLEGMVYLHHDFPEPIIHRDLKPSNILLDASLEPKVSDFGVSKFVNPYRAREGEATASSFCGTVGYMPPEYGMETRISTKGDVYSYGVILLELLTGKLPVSEDDFGENGDLVRWVRKHFRETPLEVLDPTLQNESMLNPHTKEKVMLFMHVGLLCTREAPQNRPSMLDVLGMFRQIKDVGMEVISLRSLEDLANEITVWLEDDPDSTFPSTFSL